MFYRMIAATSFTHAPTLACLGIYGELALKMVSLRFLYSNWAMYCSL